MILAKAFRRCANGADDFRAQISFPVNPVMYLFRKRVVEKSVHREVAAQCIGLRVDKFNFLRAAPILIIRLGAKRGNLKLLVAFDDDDDAEFFADRNGFVEKLFHLLRLGVRDDVKILRLAAEKKITNTAADPERGKVRRL